MTVPATATGKQPAASPALPQVIPIKLDSKTVSSLTLAGKKDVIHFDAELKGFGHRLRLGADGQVMRSWIVQYRRAGSTRRVLLGSGAVLGAEAARAEAKKLLAKVALGEDPQADKVERRDKDRVSLKSMIDEYLLQKEAQVRKRTIIELRRYLTGPYFKALHGLAIDKITRKDVAAGLVVITRENSSIAAARARAALSAFFVWAMQSGLVEANPVIGTAKPQDTKPRERLLIDQSIEDVNDPRRWRELIAIWKSCDDGSDYSKIIRLLIFLVPVAEKSELSRLAKSVPMACGRYRRAGARTSTSMCCRSCRWRWRSSTACRTWSAVTSCSACVSANTPPGPGTRPRSINVRV